MKNYNLLSLSELKETIKLTEQQYESAKKEAVKYLKIMNDKANEYSTISNIIDKREGRKNG